MPNPYQLFSFTLALALGLAEEQLGEANLTCSLSVSLLQTSYKRPSSRKHKSTRRHPEDLSLVQLESATGTNADSGATKSQLSSSGHIVEKLSLQENLHITKKVGKKSNKKTSSSSLTGSKGISDTPAAHKIANTASAGPVVDEALGTHSTHGVAAVHESVSESMLLENSKHLSKGVALPLLRTFLTVFLGMVIIRSHVMSTADMKSIGFVVARISLPLLVFRVIVTMDPSKINVSLLSSLVASRFLLQCGTAVVAAIASSPKPGSRFLHAGLFGFYVTAADDMSLGFVLVSLVYPPDDFSLNFPAYLVCLAVFQAVVSNSIALISLEIGAAAREPGSDSAKLGSTGVIWLILKNAIRNPLVPVVCSGVIFKSVLGNTLEVLPSGSLRLPAGLHDLVDVAVSPFYFLAPLQVGMRIGTQTATFSDLKVTLLGALLNLLKIALCPILACLFISLFDYWEPSFSQGELTEVLRFGVICGGIPTSAAPLVLAGTYRVGERLISGALMSSFFIAGPLMFLGCIFSGMPDNMALEAGVAAVHNVLEVPGILGALFTLSLFLHGGPRWRTVPCVVFMHLAASVILSGLSRRLLNSGSCDVLSHYTAQVYFRYQARLWGVALPWVLFAYRCGVPDALIHAEALALMYLVPLGLALPFGRHMTRELHGPFAREPCRFLYGDAEAQLEFVVCVVGLFLIAIANVALAIQHLQRASKNASEKTHTAPASSIGSPAMPSWALAMTTSCQLLRTEKFVESKLWSMHGGGSQEPHGDHIALPWEHETVDSDYMYDISSYHSGFVPQPLLDMQQQLREDTEEIDEQWHQDTFVFPVVIVSTFTVAALLLDALLAFQIHTAAGPMLLLLSSTVEALHGVLLLVIFGLSKQAVVVYKDMWSHLPWAN